MNQRDPYFFNKLVFVLFLSLLLSGLAHAVAAWTTWHDSRALLWATVLLLIPAFGFYILQRPFQLSSYWLLFWTFGFLAYLIYLLWAYVVPAGGNWQHLLPAQGQMTWAAGPSWYPVTALVLACWWLLDLLLAWPIAFQPAIVVHLPAAIRVERGFLQLVVFVFVLGATFASEAGAVLHVLGALLLVVIIASLVVRIITRRMDPEALSGRLFGAFFGMLNRCGLPWYRLPTLLGVMNLGALRDQLREKNLVGTQDIPVTNPAGRDSPPDAPSADDLRQRNVDGYHNDLRPGKAEMGSASKNSQHPEQAGEFDLSNPGSRFGRNVPREASYPDEARLLEPSPREISRQLLARGDKITEAPFLNFLAAAWIQFQIHDWFFHGEPLVGNEFRLRLAAGANGDDWDPRSSEMLIRRSRPDPTRDYALERQQAAQGGAAAKPPPPTFVNAGTHWWDASQIYGDDPVTALRLRTPPGETEKVPGGKLYIDPNKLLPIDPTNPDFKIELTGFNGNWWLGLMLLHTLFVREHNAICDHLRAEYRGWGDERIFETARLVNAALMAKIHTVEWTTAILPNPVLQIGMNINWWGLAGEPIKKVFGRISESEAFSGIPGSATNHHAADYALTEEFTSVYRMHPLMRDDLTVFSAATGLQLDEFAMTQVLGPQARARGLQNANMADLFYSFGISRPGALVLKNFPNFLRNLTRPGPDNGDRIDLATIDILRDRERGVPRYNDFRSWLRLPRFRSVDHLIDASQQLRSDPDLARAFRDIYKDVNSVDLMVGMFAETPPPQFGFSDTAFRIFILMASRRLKSDRFFTTDFTPEVYSPAGLAWVNDNNMRTVLLRHYPELSPFLRGKDNAFAPWRTLAESRQFDPYEPDLDAAP